MCCASTRRRLWQEEIHMNPSCLDADDRAVNLGNFVNFSFLSSPLTCCGRFLCRFLKVD
jgi:hypothetical protein